MNFRPIFIESSDNESGPNERPLGGRSPLESNFCRERPDERPLDHLANGQSFFGERPQHKLANGL